MVLASGPTPYRYEEWVLAREGRCTHTAQGLGIGQAVVSVALMLELVSSRYPTFTLPDLMRPSLSSVVPCRKTSEKIFGCREAARSLREMVEEESGRDPEIVRLSSSFTAGARELAAAVRRFRKKIKI